MATATFPKTLGAAIDKTYRIKLSIDVETKRVGVIIAKESKKLEKLKDNLEAHKLDVMERLRKEKIDKSSGKLASVSLKRTTHANIEDRQAIVTWMAKNGRYELLGGLSSPAFREILEEGLKVDGVSKFVKAGLALRKIS